MGDQNIISRDWWSNKSEGFKKSYQEYYLSVLTKHKDIDTLISYMWQTEIYNNCRIAKFLEYTEVPIYCGNEVAFPMFVKGTKPGYSWQSSDEIILAVNLKYHESLNDIMSIVDKIQNKGFNIKIECINNESRVSIFNDKISTETISSNLTFSIWITVIETLKKLK